jgi:PAS domain-containing protein
MTLDRSEDVALLAGVLEAVSSATIGPAVVERALEEVGASLPWSRGAIWVTDEGAQVLRPVAVWEAEADPAGEYRRRTLAATVPMGAGAPGAAWEAGRTSLVDIVDIVDRIPHPPGGGVALHHPVRAGGQVVGVLELLGDSGSDPADWIGSALVAVEPALGHLLERLRDRLAIDVAEGRLAAALDAGQFGVAALEAGSERVEWSARMAALHAQSPVRGAGPLSALLSAVHPDDVEEIGSALRSVPAPVAPDDSPMRQVDYRVLSSDDGERWVSTRITATILPGGLPQVAAISSDVTERKRAEAVTRRRAMAIEGLQWVSQAIISGRELRDTATAVSHAATGVLGATIGIVLYEVPGETTSELAWALSGIPGDLEIPPPPTDPALPADLALAETPTVIDLRWHPETRAFVLALGLPIDVRSLRSALLVPVRGDERHRRLGTMVFLHPDAGHFTDDDVRLAQSIGASTGVAIENAQRHEQRRLASMAFQRELLSDPDVAVDGVDVCVRYHPGRDGIEVGGDWYDVMTLSENRIGLAVGDVCGHGLTAAAHMGQFRHSFRALVQSSVSPEEALRVLNGIALDELCTTMTMVYVELDTRTGEGMVWRCGHLPPVVATPGHADVRWLADDEGGPMLGFLPELAIRPSPVRLEPGELLLLYTDGLVERRGESIEAGLHRLADALVTPDLVGGVAPIDNVCDLLHERLAERGPDADDTATLAVRRHRPEES